jgi:hypothetical protein
MTIAFDPLNKRIILDTSSVTATEIYSRWVDWAALSDNAKYGIVLRQVGSDDLGSGLSIPPYYFLQGLWRIRPMEMDHDLRITGNLFVEGGGTPVVRTLGTYQINVNYTVPVQAQGISTTGSTSSGPTTEEIWSYVNRTLTAGTGSGPTAIEIRQEIDSNSIKLAQIKAILDSLNIPTSNENATAVWNAPVASMTDKTTIGGWISKVLMTVPKFLGLK